MSKKRVHEIAKEFGVSSKEVMQVLQQHNIPAKAAVSSVDDAGYAVVAKAFNKGGQTSAPAPKKADKSVAVHKHSH